MKSIITVAGLEIRMGLRNRWVLATSLLMTLLSLSIVSLGSSPTGITGADSLIVSIVSLASLTIFLVPLMALLLSYDSIVGEVEKGTMLLLLTYPVSRGDVIAGKFFGQVSIISFAIIFGYGAAGIFISIMQKSIPEVSSLYAYFTLIASASLMGAAFVGLGLMCSSITKQQGAAAGIAVSLWLFFVIVFDLLLLGGLVSGLDAVISEEVFPFLLLANPADAFRMLNMESVAGSGLISGMAEVSANATIAPYILWSSLLLWVLLPVLSAITFFKKRDL